MIFPQSGLVTSEGLTSDTFTAALMSEPTADVTIALSSSDPGEGTVSPASLTFTPLDWNVPQLVTVTGADDITVDGTVPYAIVTGPASSADPSYNGLDPVDVLASNANDEMDASVLVDAGFVDYVATPLSEGWSTHQMLLSLVITTLAYTGATGADINGAIDKKALLVIPEQQNNDYYASMDPAARTALANWVNLGGTLVLISDNFARYLSMANGLFGFTMAPQASNATGAPMGLAPGAVGTSLSVGPPSLPMNSQTVFTSIASLPPSARVIYSPGGDQSGLTLIPVGEGYVILWGWDMFDATVSGGTLVSTAWETVMGIIRTSANNSLF